MFTKSAVCFVQMHLSGITLSIERARSVLFLTREIAFNRYNTTLMEVCYRVYFLNSRTLTRAGHHFSFVSAVRILLTRESNGAVF